MKLGGYDIGVCDWSLPDEPLDRRIARLERLGIKHVQIALAPLLDTGTDPTAATITPYADAGITVTGGMISFPGENYSTVASIKRTGGLAAANTWPDRLQHVKTACATAAAWHLKMVSMHVGFVPAGNDPDYRPIVDRATTLAAVFADRGMDLLLETGQEKAPELLRFLNDLNARNVGVNFDPANLILYGVGDPIDAVATLGRHIRHVHIKDATLSPRPGVDWGTPRPFGRGALDHTRFIRALIDARYDGPLVIECERRTADEGCIEASLVALKNVFQQLAPSTSQ